MPTKQESSATRAELAEARNAALGAIWSVFFAGLNLPALAYQIGDPRESDWECDDFGTEAEKIFRSLTERRDKLEAMMSNRLLTPLEEAKARAGDPMPVSVGDFQFPTYHRAAWEILRRFVMMLSIGRPFAWPSWVYELVRERPGRPTNAAERYDYYKSLLDDVISFDLGNNLEELETGIRCECARALAAAPDAEDIAPVDGAASSDQQEWQPLAWFPQTMRSRIRKAAGPRRKTKRVGTKTMDGVKFYSAKAARRYWARDLPK